MGSDTETAIGTIYYMPIPDLSSVVAIGSRDTDSNSDQESAFYVAQSETPDPETTLEDLYGPLNSEIATGKDLTVHRDPNLLLLSQRTRRLLRAIPCGLSFMLIIYQK